MTSKAEQKIKALKAAVAYEDGLNTDLQDKDFAAEYLNAAMEEGNETLFLIALRDVVKAQGGVASVAEQTDLSRTNLYAMLSDKGNPRFHNLLDLLKSLGLGLQVKPTMKTSV